MLGTVSATNRGGVPVTGHRQALARRPRCICKSWVSESWLACVGTLTPMVREYGLTPLMLDVTDATHIDSMLEVLGDGPLSRGRSITQELAMAGTWNSC